MSTSRAVHGGSPGEISKSSNTSHNSTHTKVENIDAADIERVTSFYENMESPPQESSTRESETEESPILGMSIQAKQLVEKLSKISDETVAIRGLCEDKGLLMVLDKYDKNREDVGSGEDDDDESSMTSTEKAVACAISMQKMCVVEQTMTKELTEIPLNVEPDLLEDAMTKVRGDASSKITDASEAWTKLAGSLTLGSADSSTTNFWKEVQGQSKDSQLALDTPQKRKRRSLSEVIKRCTSCLSSKKES